MAKIVGNHHVHFLEDEVEERISEISVDPDDEGRLIVNVGFLKIKHQYKIHFRIKDNLGDVLLADPDQNEYVKLLDNMPTTDGDGHELIMELKTDQEKLMEERVIISSGADPSQWIEIIIHASVLGSGQGTPILRHGVHCMASFEEKVTVVLGMESSLDDASDYLA